MTYTNPGRRRLCAMMACLLLVEGAGPVLSGQQPMGEFNPHANQPAQQPAAAGQPPAAPGAQPGPAPNSPVINGVIQFGGFTLQNASLTEVVDTLARQLKINYILPKVFGGSVTLNTYGDTKNIDARKLLDLILRINGYGMVQTGDVYRIVPLSDISHQPLRPERLDSGKISDEDSPMLNLVFLKYITADELAKVISSFQGEGAQIITYQPANLMLILDSRRNIKRTMELIGLFDDNTLANQRVHSFDIKNSKPSDLAKELEGIFKSISMNPGDKGSPIKFVPVDRINVLLALAPNPGAFELVGDWIKKLDLPAEIIKGARENYVYRVKYAQAQILAMVIYALYTGQNPFGGGMGMSGGYGGYGASGFGGGMGTGYGASGMGTGTGGYGGNYGGTGNGMGSYGNGYGGASAFNTAGLGGANAGGYAAYSGTGIPTGAGMASAGASLPSAGATSTLGGTTNPNGIGSTGTYLGEGNSAGQVNPNLPHIIPNPMDNTLLIQATPSDYKSIQKLLGEIDVPPRQVLIDAKIYEIDLSGALSVGVETYLQQVGSASSTGSSTTGGATTPGTQQSNTHQFLASLVSGAASLSVGTYVGKSRELLGFVQFEETLSKAKTISSPSIIATDSIPASINVGTSLPTISSQAVQSGVQVGGTNPYAETIQNVDTGIQLNVLARVTPAGIVTMVINQDVSAPTGGSAGSLTPSFEKRNVSTQVTIQDGDTIALGGAIQETVTESTNGIPFLDRIPGLSWLFSQKSYSKARTELIVFLTPHVLYDTNSVTDASDELRDKMKLLQRIIRDDKDQ